jgi:hypothetical protein
LSSPVNLRAAGCTLRRTSATRTTIHRHV